MKHPSSRALYAYWDKLRAGRAAPERGELDPGAIRSILGDVMILEVGGPHRYAVRLAGTWDQPSSAARAASTSSSVL